MVFLLCDVFYVDEAREPFKYFFLQTLVGNLTLTERGLIFVYNEYVI